MTRIQNEIANKLKEHYDCILKMDAIRFIKEKFDNVSLKDIIIAYESLDY